MIKIHKLKPASIYFMLIGLWLAGCATISDEDVDLAQEEESLTAFSFPERFDFSTKREINLSFEKSPDPGKYVVSYDWEGISEIVATINAQGANNELQLEIPTGVEELIVSRITGSEYQNIVLSLSGSRTQKVSFPKQAGRLLKGCQDRLYAVENSFGGFWEIDLQQGDYTENQLADLQGGGSIACALDQENGYLYYNVGRTLYRYDISTASFEVVFNSNPFNGSYPRMEYHEGFFYMSNSQGNQRLFSST